MTQPVPAIELQMDKATYAPGEQMVATVRYQVPADSVAVLYAGIRVLGAESRTPQLTIQIAELLMHDDNPGRIWTMQSNDGSTAVFTAVA